MGNTWIESHTTLRANKKLKPFCEDLNITRAAAIGHLHMLWWWAIENRENGDLSGLFDKDIAVACDWSGDPKRLLKALKRSKWLTPDMKINDWLTYAGRLLKDRERKRFGRIVRHSEDIPRTVHGHSEDVSLLTEPNRTVPNRTVKEKDPVFCAKDEQIIRKDIAKSRNVSPDSEAATIRFQEIITELGKVKSVDSALALARHKALRQ